MSDMCMDITEFVVAEDPLSPQGEGDLSPPQMKWYPHTYHQTKMVLFLYLIKERHMVRLKINKSLEYSLIMNSATFENHIKW